VIYPTVLYAGNVQLSAPEQGGRRRPVCSGYRCQFRLPQEVGGASDWDAMIILWVASLAPGANAPGLLLPPSGHLVWEHLVVPGELGMYEGSRRIGTFELKGRYLRGDG